MKSVVLLSFVLTAVVADVAFLNYNRGQNLQRGGEIRILKQNQEIDPAGSYNYAYETENGINVREEGQLIQSRSSQEPGTAAQGSYRYTSPEGLPVDIVYVADENGFQPQGNVLPTPPAPPAIPPAILRALEWNRAHPEEERPQQQQQRYRF
nr:larval cuticle protein LCP-17-like [Onthophagus taurus]